MAPVEQMYADGLPSDAAATLDALRLAMPEISRLVVRTGVDGDDADRLVGAFVFLLAPAIKQAARQSRLDAAVWPVLAARVASGLAPAVARLASQELQRQPCFLRTASRWRRAIEP